jgi:hypothetical protein
MARKKKDKTVVGEKSPEYLEFEAFTKRVLSVPKTDIDRREAEDRERRHAPPKRA